MFITEFFKKCYLIFLLFPNLVVAQEKPDSLNACWIIVHKIDAYSIRKNARIIISKSKDDCVLALMNKIADSSFGSNANRYFKVISSIQTVSDGYVSEYLNEIAVKLFNKNFDKLFRYIFNSQGAFKSPIEKLIIESIGIEISDDKDRKAAERNVASFLGKKENELNMNFGEKAYIESLKKKIYEYAQQQ